METKFYTDDFEQLLKEKSDEFRMYPSKRVWHSIYNDLHPGRKWPSIAVSLILIIALLMVGYWNDNASIPVVVVAQKTNPDFDIAGNKNKAGNTYTLPADLIPGDINKLSQQDYTSSSQSQNNPVKNNASYNTVFAPANAYLAVNHRNETEPTGNAIIILPSANIADRNIYAIDKATEALVISNENNLLITDAVAATTKSLASSNTAARQQLKAAVALLHKKETNKGRTAKDNNDQTADSDQGIVPDKSTGLNINDDQNNSLTATGSTTVNEKNGAVENEAKLPASTSATGNSAVVTESSERVWIEDYAFHNKSKRKNWQDRTAIGFYITPSVGYRNLSNNSKYNSTGGDANKSVSHAAALNFEAGFNVNYAIAKKIKVTAGIQANYSNYRINAEEISHPVLTTLMLLDDNSGYPYMNAATSTLANTPGHKASATVHNKTYQLSVPVGLALKLSGSDHLEWYAGATIQPTLVLGGKNYVISADRKNYVSDPSLMRKWNVNTGFETYINYKLSNFTLQAGPQFRYQLLSTYYKKYTVNENLYNIGFKVGILKNF